MDLRRFTKDAKFRGVIEKMMKSVRVERRVMALTGTLKVELLIKKTLRKTQSLKLC